MKRKITTIVLIAALALVSATLVGVTFAQLATPNPSTQPNQLTAPWCINPNGEVATPCINGTGNAAANCINNGTCINGSVCPTGTQACSINGVPQTCSQNNWNQQQGTNVFQGGRMGNCGRWG